MPYIGPDPILIGQAAQQAQAQQKAKSGNVVGTLSSVVSGIAVPLLAALFPGGLKGNANATPAYSPYPYTPGQQSGGSGLLDNIPLLAVGAVAAYFLFFRKKKRKK